MTHVQWDLLSKTELRVEQVGLDRADLDAAAAAVAEVLSLGPREVYVIDARENLITFDLLRDSIDPYQLVGRSKAVLDALARVPGVTVTESSRVTSDGMLGWIDQDETEGKAALDRSRQMAEEIQQRIARRAIVFSTGNEVVEQKIRDTNNPWIRERLEDAGFVATSGGVVRDDLDALAWAMREAVEERGFGLVVTSGGVGAETKDGTVEALLSICPEASTPYLFRVQQGHGRHVKPGVRIGVGSVAGATVVCLPGPHAEVRAGMAALVVGLAEGLEVPALAEQIASALRARLRRHGEVPE